MNEFRFVLSLLARALANALAGGLAFAIVGAFCGGGAAFALIFGSTFSFGAALGLSPYGAVVGAMCGIVGVIIHFFVAVLARPGDFWEPLLESTKNIAFGQSWGTIAAVASFFVFESARSLLSGSNFARSFAGDMPAVFVAAPAMMVFGAIAAAVLKRD